jgi:phosphoribosylanthranilate isomerase
MTWIKICGITNLEDARTAVDAGADALGFVFWEKSPRRIDPKTARAIVAQLPEGVEKVGVFVDAPQESTTDSVMDILNAVHLTALQCHLPFDAASHQRQQKHCGSVGLCGLKVYPALPAAWIVGDEQRLTGMIESFEHWGEEIPPEVREQMPGDAFGTFFLDAGSTEQPGGTGKTFDWGKAIPLVEAMRSKVKVVVAGGLNPTNVGEAIRILHPWGVDVASGVEARPGKKDPEKVRAFVKAVREADKSA